MAQPMHAGPLVTPSTLTTALTSLGIRPGQILLIHSSLSSLGFVPGGAETLVRTLLALLGPAGTLVVPTHTPANSDPAGWCAPPVPESWWDAIRESTPGFEPALTPSSMMGVVPEMVRTWPGAVRSAHPQTSFAAVGHGAGELMGGHEVDCKLGQRSPLARLEERGAWVLLLGVGWGRCTSFHLAEDREGAKMEENSFAAMKGEGAARERVWMTVRDVGYDGDDFERMGGDFERECPEKVRLGKVGGADARLVEMRDAVEYARHWLPLHRGNNAGDG